MKKTEPRLGVNKGAQVTTSTTAVKTSLESNFFLTLSRLSSLVQRIEFVRSVFMLGKIKKNSSAYVHVLLNTSHQEVSRRSCAVDANEIYQKVEQSCYFSRKNCLFDVLVPVVVVVAYALYNIFKFKSTLLITLYFSLLIMEENSKLERIYTPYSTVLENTRSYLTNCEVLLSEPHRGGAKMHAKSLNSE